MRTFVIGLLGLMLSLCLASPGAAYLPWTEACARDDPKHAAAIVIGRVTEITVTEEMEGDKDAQGNGKFLIRSYFARLKVGEVIKGSVKKGETIELFIGYSGVPIRNGEADETRPAPIVMCNTQCGYDVRVNNVYYMALSPIGKSKHWDLTSGPFSLGLVLSDSKIKLGRLSHGWSDEINFADFVSGIKKQVKSE
jgi:hypothetical protein